MEGDQIVPASFRKSVVFWAVSRPTSFWNTCRSFVSRNGVLGTRLRSLPDDPAIGRRDGWRFQWEISLWCTRPDVGFRSSETDSTAALRMFATGSNLKFYSPAAQLAASEAPNTITGTGRAD